MWDSEYMRGISEGLMTGKVPIDQVFDTNPLDKLYKRRKPKSSVGVQCQTTLQNKSTNTPAEHHDSQQMQQFISATMGSLQRQLSQTQTVIADMEQRLNSIEKLLGELTPVIKIGKSLESLNRSMAEMMAKYDHLVISTGRTTAPAAAYDAYLQEHGIPPPQPAIFKNLEVAQQATCPKNVESNPVSKAAGKVANVLELNEETFSKPNLSAKDLALLLFTHLPGNNTPFHILAQVLAKLSYKAGKSGAFLDAFHQILSEGENAQAALTRLSRTFDCFLGASPPIIKVRNLQSVPRPCQKSLRALPPNPSIDKGWVCIYSQEDGEPRGLKI
nr:polymerase cofactor VP35 [Dehong virus]